MASFTSTRLLLLLLLLVVLAAAPAAYATVYTVGDSSGWTNGMDYSNWLSGKSFYVGDSLYFSYSMLHSVNEVSRSDYDSCSAGNSFQSYTGGSTTVPLTSTGTHYFICGTSGHCANGMRLAINVNSGSGNNRNDPNNGNNGYNPNGNNGYNPNNDNNNAAARRDGGVGAAGGLMVGLSAAVVGLAVMG